MEVTNMRVIQAILMMLCIGLLTVGSASAGAYGAEQGGYQLVKTKCGPWNNFCGGQSNAGIQICGKWHNWCGKGKGMHQGDEQSGGGGKKGKKNQVSQASCAKLGLTYVGGSGNTCYCPGQYVNKGTGLPAASSRSQCVTPQSYNQLKGL
jgi:hypothetical protein